MARGHYRFLHRRCTVHCLSPHSYPYHNRSSGLGLWVLPGRWAGLSREAPGLTSAVKWAVYGVSGALTFQLVTGLALYFLLRFAQELK